MSAAHPQLPKNDGSGTAGPEDATMRPPTPELEPGDSYMDGPYLVFTAQYHLRRGSCCNSGCRHCPYQ